jgi:hypothetical protein
MPGGREVPSSPRRAPNHSLQGESLKLYQAVISKLEDPKRMRAFAGWNVIFWIVLIPVSIFTGWVHSSAFISYLSEIALVLSSLSWWQSGRVEVKQEKEPS